MWGLKKKKKKKKKGEVISGPRAHVIPYKGAGRAPHWAAAVRRPDGTLEIASERKPELAPQFAAKFPGLRGPLRLADALRTMGY